MFYEGRDIKHLATSDDYGYVMLKNGDKFTIKIITAKEYTKHTDKKIRDMFDKVE